MIERTKPPNRSRRVESDDLLVLDDGVAYYPHAGEWVEFKGRPSVGLYLDIMESGRTSDNLKLIADKIAAWNWTDDDGNPYESPPTLETLKSLPAEEIAWLITRVRLDLKSNSKNGIAPSTPALTE